VCEWLVRVPRDSQQVAAEYEQHKAVLLQFLAMRGHEVEEAVAGYVAALDELGFAGFMATLAYHIGLDLIDLQLAEGITRLQCRSHMHGVLNIAVLARHLRGPAPVDQPKDKAAP
jgi:hypothetical protein